MASKELLNLLWLRFAPVQTYFGANAGGHHRYGPIPAPERVQAEGRLRGDDVE